MRELLAGLVALALVGCSAGGGADASDPSAVAGSEPFRALIKQSREAVEDGDLADAGRLLDEARALEPDNPALWVDIARLRFRGGEHVEALAAADRALELGPEYGPALLLRGQMVRDAYGVTRALTWFEAAVEADPNDPVALAEYAATLGDAGYYKEMLEVTRALAEVAPKDPRVFYLKAVLAARGGNPVLAKSLIERSGLVAQGVASARMLDALLDLQERNFDSAAETLEALAKEQPGNVRVTELLARAFWLGGRDAQLVERFKVEAGQPHASPYLVMMVGRALERMGERADAAPFLERAYAGRPAQWVQLPVREGLPEPTARIRRHLAEGSPRLARREGRALEIRFPGSSDIAALVGDAALAGGDAAGALASYGKAAKVRRSWPLTRKMAEAHRASGDNVLADALLADHLAGEPRNTEALLLVAEKSAREGEWLRVKLLLDNAIALGAGNDPRLLKLRGIAARELGEDEDARRFQRLTWELHPAILPGN
jgi:tetratricopeptide (TPR) repeat protein